MVRHYKPQPLCLRRKTYTLYDLNVAVKKVCVDGMSIRDAVLLHNVPRNTLHRYVSKRVRMQ